MIYLAIAWVVVTVGCIIAFGILGYICGMRDGVMQERIATTERTAYSEGA